MKQSEDSRPRLAMMLCVRDEQRFLEWNLRYHRTLGVSRAYVYLDRCTDRSASIAASFPWVMPMALDPEEAERFVYLTDLHTACMDHALRTARDEGFDWLLAVDADEFAYGIPPRRPHESRDIAVRGNIVSMIGRMPDGTDMITFETRESIPVRLGDGAPFWKQRFFLQGDEFPIKRTFRNPVTGECRETTALLGHCQGKSIIRTSADVQAYDSHRWTVYQNCNYPMRPEFVPPKTVRGSGIHYHFVVTSQSHWLQKYKLCSHEPKVWPGGYPVEIPRQWWKEAVSILPPERLADYYREWIALPESRCEDLARRGAVIEDLTVGKILSVKNQDDQDRPMGTRADRPDVETVSVYHESQPKDELRYPMRYAAERVGFHGLERDQDCYFRWTEPTARLRLRLKPRGYRVSIDMKHLSSLWNGRLTAYIDDHLVADGHHKVVDGMATFVVAPDAFSRSQDHWLKLEFDRLDTSHWPRPDLRALGAPIFEVAFEPST